LIIKRGIKMNNTVIQLNINQLLKPKKMTNLFRKGMLVLLGVGTMIACSDDDDTTVDPGNGGGTTTEITNLDFTPTALNAAGNQVGVQPSATGATSYSIDFGDGSAAVTTPGTQKSHTYAAESATYTIEVTASADGAANVVKSKDYTITYEAPNVIANFEADAEVGNIFDTSGDLGISVEDASADASSYGKVGKIVYAEEYTGWNAATLRFGKYIDLSENSVITMDIYNAEAAVVPVTMKLEGVTGNDELEAWNKIEVEVNTEAVAGWQTLTFDFADARMSGDGNGAGGLILDGPSYGQMGLFIGVTIMDGTSVIGTYEVDNIQGAGWGATIDIADTDGDGITDADDACPNEAPEEGNDSNNDGCTDGPAGSTSTVSDDMEGTSSLTWAGDSGATLEIIDNPFSGDGNTSAKVVKYVDPGAGSQYANIRFDLAADHSLKFDLTTKNVFTVNVYVPTPATPVTENLNLALKLQDGSASAPWEGQFVVDQAYVYDQWQTLTFDFSSQAAETKYSRIVIQFNSENNFEAVEAAYIDDILLQ
jgi:hypothetical protein